MFMSTRNISSKSVSNFLSRAYHTYTHTHTKKQTNEQTRPIALLHAPCQR